MQNLRFKSIGIAALAVGLCLSLGTVLFPPGAQAVGSFSRPLAIPTGDMAEGQAPLPRIGDRLIPLGRTTGIKLFSPGTMVVGFAQLERTGTCPAKDGGLKMGDVLLTLNGEEIGSNEDLTRMLSRMEGEEAVFTLLRDDALRTQTVTAVYDPSLDCHRIGAWVRDSVAGIGTVTFVDPETGAFGALGHGICDADTGMRIPFGRGSLMASSVESVEQGKKGTPGQLCGSFDLVRDQGTLRENSDAGIFGVLTDKTLWAGAEAVETAPRSAIREGDATVICNVSGIERQTFDVRILRVYPEGDDVGRDMMVEITDPDLLRITGGIVQGMSGSPILQDGKLVGAVTHVLMNDPTRGYGISIEAMLDAAQNGESVLTPAA